MSCCDSFRPATACEMVLLSFLLIALVVEVDGRKGAAPVPRVAERDNSVIFGFIIFGAVSCCCVFTCRKLCPNGTKGLFKDTNLDDDVHWSSVRDIQLAVDDKAGILSEKSTIGMKKHTTELFKRYMNSGTAKKVADSATAAKNMVAAKFANPGHKYQAVPEKDEKEMSAKERYNKFLREKDAASGERPKDADNSKPADTMWENWNVYLEDKINSVKGLPPSSKEAASARKGGYVDDKGPPKNVHQNVNKNITLGSDSKGHQSSNPNVQSLLAPGNRAKLQQMSAGNTKKTDREVLDKNVRNVLHGDEKSGEEEDEDSAGRIGYFHNENSHNSSNQGDGGGGTAGNVSTPTGSPTKPPRRPMSSGGRPGSSSNNLPPHLDLNRIKVAPAHIKPPSQKSSPNTSNQNSPAGKGDQNSPHDGSGRRAKQSLNFNTSGDDGGEYKIEVNNMAPKVVGATPSKVGDAAALSPAAKGAAVSGGSPGRAPDAGSGFSKPKGADIPLGPPGARPPQPSPPQQKVQPPPQVHASPPASAGFSAPRALPPPNSGRAAPPAPRAPPPSAGPPGPRAPPQPNSARSIPPPSAGGPRAPPPAAAPMTPGGSIPGPRAPPRPRAGLIPPPPRNGPPPGSSPSGGSVPTPAAFASHVGALAPRTAPPPGVVAPSGAPPAVGVYSPPPAGISAPPGNPPVSARGGGPPISARSAGPPGHPPPGVSAPPGNPPASARNRGPPGHPPPGITAPPGNPPSSARGGGPPGSVTSPPGGHPPVSARSQPPAGAPPTGGSPGSARSPPRPVLGSPPRGPGPPPPGVSPPRPRHPLGGAAPAPPSGPAPPSAAAPPRGAPLPGAK